MSHEPVLPNDDLSPLRAEIELELQLVHASDNYPLVAEDPRPCDFDPLDVEREQIGLTSIRDALDVLGRADDDDGTLS
jgi:hypothetical protein